MRKHLWVIVQPNKGCKSFFFILFCWFSLCIQHLPGAGRGCVRMEVGRGRAWNDALQGADTCECKDFSSFGLCPTWMRAGICGLLHHHTDPGPCCRIYCKIHCQRKDFLHPSPRTQGFASSVAGIPPSSFAGSLGFGDFPHARSTKLPWERSCSEVKQGRAHLLCAGRWEIQHCGFIISLAEH